MILIAGIHSFTRDGVTTHGITLTILIILIGGRVIIILITITEIMAADGLIIMTIIKHVQIADIKSEIMMVLEAEAAHEAL